MPMSWSAEVNVGVTRTGMMGGNQKLLAGSVSERRVEKRQNDTGQNDGAGGTEKLRAEKWEVGGRQENGVKRGGLCGDKGRADLRVEFRLDPGGLRPLG